MKAIIVDDEAVALAAMKRRIKWEKYGIETVNCASSMRQAIEIMEQNGIDLMLCDVEMPGGSGLELYEWVRTYSPDTECIFVSCHPEYEYVRKALTMGSMDYVLKPVDYEEMDRILTEASARIRSREQAGKRRTVKGQDTDSAERESRRILPDSVDGAIRYITEHLNENMSISEIADAVYLNPQYFMRLFKKETGKSVLEFITESRLNNAKNLLIKTNLPITEVALNVGYDNFSYFSKMFKRNTGVSPSEYRKKQ